MLQGQEERSSPFPYVLNPLSATEVPSAQPACGEGMEEFKEAGAKGPRLHKDPPLPRFDSLPCSPTLAGP
jgi:hypothetical protein